MKDEWEWYPKERMNMKRQPELTSAHIFQVVARRNEKVALSQSRQIIGVVGKKNKTGITWSIATEMRLNRWKNLELGVFEGLLYEAISKL